MNNDVALTSDVIALAAVIGLALVQVSMASIVTLKKAGPAWVLGPRDAPFEAPGVAGRIVRAHRNLLEVLPQFVGAVFCVHAANSVSSLASFGAWTFLAARVAYIPAYISAVPWLRPACWQLALGGLLLVLLDAFI